MGPKRRTAFQPPKNVWVNPPPKKNEPNGCFRATPQDGAGTAPPPPASAPQSAPHTPPRAPPLTPRGPRVRPARKSAGRSASPGSRVPLACLCWENRFWTKVGWRYLHSMSGAPKEKRRDPERNPSLAMRYMGVFFFGAPQDGVHKIK